MKTLLLLRHAKPNGFSPTGRDFDRALTLEGRADALLVGGFLRREQLTPGVVVCSPAARARETAAHVIEAAKLAASPLFDGRIYEASAEQLVEVVSEAGDEADVVLVVGHNPGLQELLARLTGASVPVHAATLARIDLDVDAWGELGRVARGRLVFARPPQASEGL
ncbi:MAG TPA: histidine phosphatase family protein [Pyrinomonadaceae bacterium]|nr:histidine phosphatase family protein [Pyrinomonadaceae bacterium]